MLNGWAGFILVGGAAELAGGGEPHGIAGAAARLGLARLLAIGRDEAFFLGAEGGADEVGADGAAVEGLALAEIALDLGGGAGEDGVQVVVIVGDRAAEGSVGGVTDTGVAGL